MYLSGCSILMPYSENFACEADAEYGKCTNVSGAYEEAVTGKPSGPTIKKDEDDDVYLDYSEMQGTDKTTTRQQQEDWNFEDDEFASDVAASHKKSIKNKKTVKQQNNPQEDAYLRYKNSVYRELSGLINKPKETPMVRQPTQVRTLILSYTTQKDYKPLYMPRYVYYMLDDYMWVMGGNVFSDKDEMSKVFGE